MSKTEEIRGLQKPGCCEPINQEGWGGRGWRTPNPQHLNNYQPRPFGAECWWFTPVMLGTQEAEIQRIMVQSHPRKIVFETLFWKTHHTERKREKRAGGVIQGVGPEFKLQYCKTTKLLEDSWDSEKDVGSNRVKCCMLGPFWFFASGGRSSGMWRIQWLNAKFLCVFNLNAGRAWSLCIV
jgi:hypothetical protein